MGLFGYVRPAMESLLVREARAYRAFYCGICRQLGKQCGPFCRLFLQYDFALLAILMDGLMEPSSALDESRCAVNPLNKLTAASGPAVEYAADAHGILLLGKAMDDRADGQFQARLYTPPLRRMTRKAQGRQPALAEAMHRMLKRQREAERQGADLDDASQPFAEFMREMFAPMPAASAHAEPLRWMGEHLGRWIYIADALDDYDQDAKKQGYNPLHAFGSRDAAAKAALPLLNHYAEQALMALDVLPEFQYTAIAHNILESGLFQTAEAIAAGEFSSKKRQEQY